MAEVFGSLTRRFASKSLGTCLNDLVQKWQTIDAGSKGSLTCVLSSAWGDSSSSETPYVCSSKHTGCFSRIDGQGLDAYVTKAAVDWLGGDGLVRARQQLAKGEAEHDTIQAQLAVDEAKLLELADAYADPDNDMSMAEWLRARQPIEQRIRRARKKLEQVPRLAVVADLPGTKRALGRAWKRMSVTEQRAILRAIVGRLEVGPGTPGRHGFDDSRVVLTFIDREAPNRRTGWEAGQDASMRGRIRKQSHQLPRETDPGVLGQVPRAMGDRNGKS